MSVNWLSFGGGLLLVAFVVLDALWTTVSAQGGGPLSRRLSGGVWRALTWRAGPRSTRRQVAGVVGLLASTAAWIVLLWLGWGLVFGSAASAVVASSSPVPAGPWERVYFVGFTLFTLGVGDFVPGGDLWRVLTVLASLSGLFLVTLAITYLLPVLQAAVDKRQLAAAVSGLGSTGAEIAALGSRAPQGLSRQLEAVAAALTLHTERHLVYPVLHYFESGERATALAPNVAALSDALLLCEALPADRRPDAAALTTVRSALGGYLDTMDDVFLDAEDDAPPIPSPPAALDIDAAVVASSAGDHDRDRRRLLALVRQSGWGWPTGEG